VGVVKLRWVLAAACALLALAACGPKVKTSTLSADQASALCAASETAAAIKGLVFDAAGKQTAPSNRLALAQLARQANLRIEGPLLDSYDKDARKTTCSGHLHLNLPPGAVRNLGDTSDLTTSIKYSVEPSVPGGLTYQLSGADALASGIAGADISEWASKLQPGGMPAEGAPIPAAAPGALPSPTTAPSALATPADAPVRPAMASPMRPAEPLASRRCSSARSYADRTICSDPELAAEDHRISALYRAALANDDTGEVRRVAQSERGAREGCQDRDCIIEWFKQREADLSPR
jgi:hypothetical protein